MTPPGSVMTVISAFRRDIQRAGAVFDGFVSNLVADRFPLEHLGHRPAGRSRRPRTVH